MKGSLVIVGFFVLGILAGLSGIVPEKIVEGNLTFYALCALLFFVGIGVEATGTLSPDSSPLMCEWLCFQSELCSAHSPERLRPH